MKQREQTVRIRQFITDTVGDSPSNIVRRATSHFKISRQAVQRHLNALVAEKVIHASGNTRAKRYALLPVDKFSLTLRVDGLAEDVPWREQIRPRLLDVPANVVALMEYGFTELLNNVIEHSKSEQVFITYSRTAADITIRIHDFGVGIFLKIMTEMNLPDEVSAIWELAKGKLTTDPVNHTGEGIFFTSRMCDYFTLMSGTLFFSHAQPDNDWLMEDTEDTATGTHARMTISLRTSRTCDQVFHEFDDPEKFDYAFAKTRVPVSLMQYGHENLVSRSQAKRLLNRFDRFREVMLDFNGVGFIGQGFADEVFRVFVNSHPEVQIVPVNMSPSVKRMIAHVKGGGQNASLAGADQTQQGLEPDELQRPADRQLRLKLDDLSD